MNGEFLYLRDFPMLTYQLIVLNINMLIHMYLMCVLL